MKSSLTILPVLRLTAVLLIAFAGGIINGLIGAGSGIVFLFLWPLLSSDSSDQKARYAFSMTCVMIISVISLFLYPAEASLSLPLPILTAAVLTGILGGTCGAYLKDTIKTSRLNLIFALLTLYSGLSMVLR